jgi:hypothetical protein
LGGVIVGIAGAILSFAVSFHTIAYDFERKILSLPSQKYGSLLLCLCDFPSSIEES